MTRAPCRCADKSAIAYQIPNPKTNHLHFGGSAFPLSKWFDPTSIGLDKATTVYVGFVAVLANIVVAALVTLVCKLVGASDGVDSTSPDDYSHDPEQGESEPPPPYQEDELPEPVPVT